MAFHPSRSFQRSKIVKDQNDFSNDSYNESYVEGDNNEERRAFRNHEGYDNSARGDRRERRDRRDSNYDEGRSSYRNDRNDRHDRHERQDRREFSPRPSRPRRDDNSFDNKGYRDNNFVREPYAEKKNQRFSRDEQYSPRPRYNSNNSYEGRRNETRDNNYRNDRNSYNDRNNFSERSSYNNRNSYNDRPYREQGERSSHFSSRGGQDYNSRNSERFSRDDRFFDRNKRNFQDEHNTNDAFFSPEKEYSQENSHANHDKNFFANSSQASANRQERESNLRERSDRNFNNNGGVRDRAPRQRGRTSRFYENLVTLFDVDKELLNLLFRRAELLDGVKRDNRISPNLEKKLRLAWEGGTAKITKDPRIARDFFNLLQQLEPIPYAYSKPNYYSLAPQFTPVQIDLKGAFCSRQMRMLFALAAASGSMTSFNIFLSPTLMSSIKAFNQLGGQLWWEGHDRVLSRGGSGIMHYLDKVVPVGSDELSFYLVLALTLLVPARLKLVGDGPLRFLDTQAIKNFLPQLNARLTTVIPGQDGIPVRVESAGMMPDKIKLSDDLPKDFIISLMLVSCMRKDIKNEIEFTLEAHPDKMTIKSELLSVLAAVGVSCTVEENNEALLFKVTPQTPVFSEDISVDIDSMFASCLLAMPAFAGGKAVLHGKLNEKDAYSLEFLQSTGLIIKCEDGLLISEHPGKKLGTPDISKAPSYPMALIFSILSALSGEEVQLPEISERFANEVQEDIVHGFLAQIGLKVNDDNILVRCEVDSNAWFVPNSDWGLAISLLAFMRPNILLVNPEIVTSIYPMFWRVYNTLPNPTTEPAAKEEVKEEEEKKTRRVIASEIIDESLEDDFDNDFTNFDEEFSEPFEFDSEEKSENDEDLNKSLEEDDFFEDKGDFEEIRHPDDENR